MSDDNQAVRAYIAGLLAGALERVDTIAVVNADVGGDRPSLTLHFVTPGAGVFVLELELQSARKHGEGKK